MVNGSQIAQQQGCVPKGEMEQRCNTTIMEQGATTKICCCDTHKCNNDDFVSHCLADSNSSKTLTVSLYILVSTTIFRKALL